MERIKSLTLVLCDIAIMYSYGISYQEMGRELGLKVCHVKILIEELKARLCISGMVDFKLILSIPSVMNTIIQFRTDLDVRFNKNLVDKLIIEKKNNTSIKRRLSEGKLIDFPANYKSLLEECLPFNYPDNWSTDL